MKALILCGGLGTRLTNSSNGIPKPLIPVGGRSSLYRILAKLNDLGTREVLLNTHFKPSEFSNFVETLDFDMQIQLSHEEELLGPAGTLKRHIDWLSSSNFWVMHGDNIFEDNLITMKKEIDQTDNPKIMGALGAFRSKNHKKVGIIRKDFSGKFVKIYEKRNMKYGFLANSAIYYFKPEVSQYVKKLDDLENDISRHLLPKLTRKIQVIKLRGSFIDIGTPEDLLRAQVEFAVQNPKVNNVE